MLCPNCHKDSKVTDSRDDGKTIRRRRECLKCGHRFTTYERIEQPKLFVIKRDKSLQPFDQNKLAKGIRLCFEKRPINPEQIDQYIDDIVVQILSTSNKEISSRQIGDIVIAKIKQIDEVAYLRFISVYKSFNNAQTFIREADKLLQHN